MRENDFHLYLNRLGYVTNTVFKVTLGGMTSNYGDLSACCRLGPQ